MRLRVVASTAVIVVTAGLSGCAPQPPTFAELRTEVTAALEDILARLPTGSAPHEIAAGAPGPCRPGTASFTWHLFVKTAASFDGESFIEQLPGKLPDDFIVADDGVKVSFPRLALDHTSASIDIWYVERNGVRGIDIIAISRCGDPPPEHDDPHGETSGAR